MRVVAATHRDLEAMNAAGTFRMDLLYRLNTVTLRIPPLRARTMEIPALADLFLQEAGRATGVTVTSFSSAAMERLKAYHWPGNVRELRNVVERAVMISQASQIQPEDLPEHIRDYEEASIPQPNAALASQGKDPFSGKSARTYGELQDQLRDFTQDRERELLVDASGATTGTRPRPRATSRCRCGRWSTRSARWGSRRSTRPSDRLSLEVCGRRPPHQRPLGTGTERPVVSFFGHPALIAP